MPAKMTKVIGSQYMELESYVERNHDPDMENREETPQESGLMIHEVPEGGSARWNHVEDLDSFFSRMYQYHQKHGFTCMMVQEGFELGQLIFIVAFSIFLVHCIDYQILFKDKVTNSTTGKISINDVIVSKEECLASMGVITWSCIVLSVIFWILRAVKFFYHLVQFWDIKAFFNTALKIQDADLDNLTWREVQKKIIEVQKELEMCIHKRDLTELDIYHRILRFKNYQVAMINKSLLPVRLKFPIIGEVIFMTSGLKYNMELLLFWGPWSPFENNWHLKEDYKKINKRHELAKALSKHILWVGLVNIGLSVLIFAWQILYLLYNYGELIKREPDLLGARTWSLYGKLYLRHFNELDHELNARLNRAYRPASKYMSIFTSPLMTVIAKNVSFVVGSICFVLVLLTVYDEDVITVEHVLTIMTIMGTIFAVARAFIPDENLVWCPETLLTAVLANTHYRPDSWRGHAHTQTTRAQVAQLFQYKAVHILEELTSPLITPYILCFRMRQRALDIVDFYRNFTIEVTGVGDVCSFAQMDVKKHGHPMWQTVVQTPVDHPQEQQRPSMTGIFSNQYGGVDQLATSVLGGKAQNLQEPLTHQYTQAEDGKTELSLIHFTLTNPEWKPPSHAEDFVTALRERAIKEAGSCETEERVNPFFSSLNSLSSLGPEYNNIVNNILRSTIAVNSQQSSMREMFSDGDGIVGMSATTESRNLGLDEMREGASSQRVIFRGMNKAEGTIQNERSFLYNIQQATSTNQSLGASVFNSRQEFGNDLSIPIELTAVDMSLSTLYMHELHHKQVKRRGYQETATRSIWQPGPVQEIETLPEIRQERAPLLRYQDSSIRGSNVKDT